MYYQLFLVIYLIFSLSCSFVQIMAGVHLLPEKGREPWMILVGATISIVGGIPFVLFELFEVHFMERVYYLVPALSLLGSLLSWAGVLLYALHRRGRRNRIAELEAIIESMQKS